MNMSELRNSRRMEGERGGGWRLKIAAPLTHSLPIGSPSYTGEERQPRRPSWRESEKIERERERARGKRKDSGRQGENDPGALKRII